MNSKCYRDALNLEKEIKGTLEKKEQQKLAMELKERERRHELEKKKLSIQEREKQQKLALEVKERERKHELEKARLAMEPEARERRHELQKQTIEAARQVALKTHRKISQKRSYTLAGLGWR